MQSVFGEYLRKMMYLKINNPKLDFKNAQLFGTEPDVFAPKQISKFAPMEFKEEYKYKDLSVYFLRPLSEMTRREIKAFKAIIENKHDWDTIKKKHPIIEIDKA